MSIASPFPLQWPQGRPWTLERKKAQFGQKDRRGWHVEISVTTARERLMREIELLRVTHPVLSTNIELRLDGMPRSGQDPADPGVALYFHLDGKPHCLACDKWNRAADNIAAIAKHIEATRGLARWGCGDTATLFSGFQALPPPETQKAWWMVLGLDGPETNLTAAERQYRLLAKRHHPDVGGDRATWDRIQRAIEEARAQ